MKFLLFIIISIFFGCGENLSKIAKTSNMSKLSDIPHNVYDAGIVDAGSTDDKCRKKENDVDSESDSDSDSDSDNNDSFDW